MSIPSLAETVASFNARSPSYDDSQMHQVVAQRVVEAADPQLGQTLLDLAGGTGLVARAAVPRGIRAVVLDASPGMLREAHAQEPRLLRIRADAHHVPLRDRSVDLVTCVTALHLFAEPEQALREAARVCRLGGRVLFTTWKADGWSIGRTFREAAAQEGVALPDPSATLGTEPAAAELAGAAGLHVDRITTIGCAEPITDRAHAWPHVVQSATARSNPRATTDAVRCRFERLLGPTEEHKLLLLTCRPQTSSPSR